MPALFRPRLHRSVTAAFLPLSVLALAAVLVSLAPSAHGAARHHHKKKKPSDPLTVKPSEAIEARVQAEITAAGEILAHLETGHLLQSPYLVSAIYYHDGFLSRFDEDRTTADPARRIIAHIIHNLAPEQRCQYIQLLQEQGREHAPDPALPQFVVPLRYSEPRKSRRKRRTHTYAIDLFAPEGTPIHSASPGLVLLAEDGWRKGDPFSSSSQEGGNTIIIFDTTSRRFFRYAHLESVLVKPGDFVPTGEEIGKVGHTGLNASRHGHGRHLHFEVNYVEGDKVESMPHDDLLELLRGGPLPEPSQQAADP